MPRRIRRTRRKPKSFLQKALPVAKKAFQIARKVASMVNTEYKYFINGISLTSVDWNGTIYSLTYPSQGVTASERTGDSIKMTDLVIRGEWNRNVLG